MAMVRTMTGGSRSASASRWSATTATAATLFWLLLCCCCCLQPAASLASDDFTPLTPTATSASLSRSNETSAKYKQTCTDGLIIPMWKPANNLSVGDRVARGLVYFIAMLYLFIGVSIVADRFMAAIEVITSQEKEIKVKKANGDVQIVVVRVWNETVANLSLMALGSSAPEILLSIIEVWAKNYEAGDLGPGTIVGSAAFNLFMIIGLCVTVIPDGEVRKIKHLRVFFVTALWSIFAYVWLYVIISVSSPGIIDIWEAVITFMFFPLTVLTAYIADRRMLFYKYLSKQYRINRRGVIVETEGMDQHDLEMAAKNALESGLKSFDDEDITEEMREFEEHRRQYIELLRELRKKNPHLDMRSLESLAREELANSGPKSRAFYRMQATRKLTGGTNLVKKAIEKEQSDLQEIQLQAIETNKEEEHIIRVCFDPGHYTVMENVGEFEATVRREGGDLTQTVLVDYRTEDGSANAGADYIATQGTLTFGPQETVKTFPISVIDDDVFEQDEHFYVRLTNVRLAPSTGSAALNGSASAQALATSPNGKPPQVQLVAPCLATVMILDDDHCGIFNLADKDVELVESVGTYECKVTRWSGARGRVGVPFQTIDGTAKGDKDYVPQEGLVVFENNEFEKFISLQILEEDSYEKDVLFYVEIGEPYQLEEQVGSEPPSNLPISKLSDEEKVALLGRPKLGEVNRTQIRVKESKEFKNTVDKLVQRANNSLAVGTSSWKEQFVEAITVNSSDEDEEGEEGDEGEEKMPSCGDYVLHFLTLFWKILFAFVPPTDRFGGWLCFIVAIIWIGILTAVIGDVASAFGCSVGLQDSVTAIAFVALGTSVPDTFASKVAAVQDKYADASVGNVTGSNAVNVFLGIGIAWSIAAIKKWSMNDVFKVNPGSLAFSVTLFCTTAALAMGIMMVRRCKYIGGELGGPKVPKYITSAIFVFLWLFYVLMSSLEAYGIIQGF